MRQGKNFHSRVVVWHRRPAGKAGGGWMLAAVFAAVFLGTSFLLPRLLWPLGERAWVRTAACLLAALLWALLVWFSFLPPEHPLFADLSGAVRTFLTIPV